VRNREFAAVSETVQRFYDTHADEEWGRLDLPLPRIELQSTLRLIDKYFPKDGSVADIGCGPGRYSLELARRGFAVSLADLSRVLVARARKAFAATGLEAAAFVQSDARDLSAFHDASFDAALSLGPLYHILELDGRTRVLSELRRVLKPNGVAIVAYLNSWGLLRTGIADFPRWYRDAATLRSLLDNHSYSEAQLNRFTEAYWCTPPVATREIEEAGFEIVSYAGAEGFCGGMWPMIKELALRDPEAYENVVRFAAETSELPQYRDATDHLHFVLRKTA
jgi:ubiquinone/menaquinone biosynthesis C-methylase UbiE